MVNITLNEGDAVAILAEKNSATGAGNLYELRMQDGNLHLRLIEKVDR